MYSNTVSLQQLKGALQKLIFLIDSQDKLQVPQDIFNDALLYRFHSTNDLLWLAIKDYLFFYEGVITNSPRQCYIRLNELRLINEIESRELININRLKNEVLTKHHIEFIEKLVSNMGEYLVLFKKVLAAIDR